MTERSFITTRVLVEKLDDGQKKRRDLGLDAQGEDVWVPAIVFEDSIGFMRESMEYEGTAVYTVGGQYWGTIEATMDQIEAAMGMQQEQEQPKEQ